MVVLAILMLLQLGFLSVFTFMVITTYPLTLAAVLAFFIALYFTLLHLHWQEEIKQRKWWFDVRNEERKRGGKQPPSTFRQGKMYK